jgi:hypothetical protein
MQTFSLSVDSKTLGNEACRKSDLHDAPSNALSRKQLIGLKDLALQLFVSFAQSLSSINIVRKPYHGQSQ